MQMPRSLFISHGGGPLPLLGDVGHTEMVSCLQSIASTIPRPAAIVVVSAHWEEPVPAITSAPNPPLIYDYYGFPPESYEIQYPCAGHPELAQEVHRRLDAGGIEAHLDGIRGLDHGVFVPLKIMYPEADIPCVQLSLVNNLDAASHIEMGRALRGLDEENVLLVGSGFSFHNLKAFFAPDSPEARQLNDSFDAWLYDVCANPKYSETQRGELLQGWNQAPGARFCHPRAEHLMPLHVCYGAARAPCAKRFELTIMNKKSSMYVW